MGPIRMSTDFMEVWRNASFLASFKHIVDIQWIYGKILFNIEEGKIKRISIVALGSTTCCREWRRSIIDEYDKVCSSTQLSKHSYLFTVSLLLIMMIIIIINNQKS